MSESNQDTKDASPPSLSRRESSPPPGTPSSLPLSPSSPRNINPTPITQSMNQYEPKPTTPTTPIIINNRKIRSNSVTPFMASHQQEDWNNSPHLANNDQHQQTKKMLFTNMYKKCPITIGEIITIIGWFIATGVCIWYIYDSTSQFIVEQNTPTTSTSFVESVPLYFPAITICNWNAMVECDYCNLTLRFATRVNAEYGTVDLFEIPYEMVTIFQNGQLFNCYAFNNFTINEHLLAANATGYAGTISFYFDVPNVPEERDARFGLQVSFHEPGSIPKVFAETNFAISGVDNYFVLTKIVTETLKPTLENPDLIGVRWDSLLSIVELTSQDPNLIVISVAYASLNENKITELLTSSIEGLLGQIAGIIGIFMGIDVLKILRGLLEVPYAVKKKSARGLWENFN